MTKQEYFNLLIQSAKDGTFPSARMDECLYRGDHGERCAVGLLIPDELYDEKMEGLGVDNFSNEFLEKILPEGLTKEDLGQIQFLHDFWADEWDAKHFIRELKSLPCFQEYRND